MSLLKCLETASARSAGLAILAAAAAALVAFTPAFAQPRLLPDAPPPSPSDSPPDLSGQWLIDLASVPLKTKDGEKIPFQPWTREVYDQTNADIESGKGWLDPRTLCRPDGATDMLMPPYILRLVQTEDKVFMLQEYNNQVRTVRMNAELPPNPKPTWYGYSVGRWDGPDLVIDTVGIDTRAPLWTLADSWTRRTNFAHSEALHVTERLKLVDGGKRLVNEVTVDDPKAYTRPWTFLINYVWTPDRRPLESICADSPLELGK